MERRIQRIIIVGASLLCFLAGLYVAVSHTISLFASHNYLFGLLGDDALDGAPLLYPILLGQKSFLSIFQPYADHRLVIERLLGMVDYLFTNGTQAHQPYRLAFTLWLGFLVFVYGVLYSNKSLDRPIKFLIAGVYLSFIFAGVTLVNYGSSLMNTWPYVLLFTLLAFVFAEKYCTSATLEGVSNKRLYTLILVTFLFITLTIYTFGVGLVLWPIVFLMLMKRGCLKRNFFTWICCAMVSYVLYTYDGWQANATKMGISNFFHGHFVEMFLYFSRLVSIPIIPNAASTVTLSVILVGLAVLSVSMLFILLYLKKYPWSSSDSIVFSYLIFGFLTLIMICLSRFWMEFEAVSVALRFTITNFILMICVLVSCYTFLKGDNETQLLAKTSITMLTTIGLLVFFIPGDINTVGRSGVYDMGFWNQFLIAEATNVPIDEGFEKEVEIQNQRNIAALNFLNDTQKKYGKGVYSFWPSHYVNHHLGELNFDKLPNESKVTLVKTVDFRKWHNPALFVDVTLENQTHLRADDWYILFTNSKNIIVGFGISAPYLVEIPTLREIAFTNTQGARVKFVTSEPLIPYSQYYFNKLTGKQNASLDKLFWHGVINTAYMQGESQATVWLANAKSKMLYRLSEIKV